MRLKPDVSGAYRLDPQFKLLDDGKTLKYSILAKEPPQFAQEARVTEAHHPDAVCNRENQGSCRARTHNLTSYETMLPLGHHNRRNEHGGCNLHLIRREPSQISFSCRVGGGVDVSPPQRKRRSENLFRGAMTSFCHPFLTTVCANQAIAMRKWVVQFITMRQRASEN